MAQNRLPPKGPKRPRIAIVGEFPVDKDFSEGEPFASGGGWHLKQWLSNAGIDFESCYRTYVFKSTPPGADINHWAVTSKEAKAALPPKTKYPYQPISSRGTTKLYLPKEMADGTLRELRSELDEIEPNLILALGRAASWAFLGDNRLDNLRGRVAESSLCPGRKVLPTYGPIAVIRSYDLFPIAMADLLKAERESHFQEIRIPPREIWINPTLSECWDFFRRYIDGKTNLLSIDIESEREQVTCIGFAPDRHRALVVPFWDKTKPNWSYWPSLEDEILAWDFVRHVVSSPIPQLGQNFLYDIQFTLRTQGISFLHPAEDTMLLHHCLQPEMEKGLGFLASIHTDNPSWKGMRKEAKAKEAWKADE